MAASSMTALSAARSRRALAALAVALAVVLALGLAQPATAPEAAAQAAPRDTVERKLAEFGIAQGQVRSIEMIAQKNSSGGARGHVRGYAGWVRVAGCDGFVVINTSRTGGFDDAYTTGGCAVTGLPRY